MRTVRRKEHITSPNTNTMNYLSNLKNSYSSGNLPASLTPSPVGSTSSLKSRVPSIMNNLSSSSLSTMGSSYAGASNITTQAGTHISRGQSASEPVILLGKLIRWLETKALVQDSAADDLFDASVTAKFTKETEALHQLIQKDGDVGTLSGFNPVVVGEVFRRCLLELEPLTTEEMYDAFMLTHSDVPPPLITLTPPAILNYQDKVKYLRSVLMVLPKYSQILLRQTINLLQSLVDYRNTKMTSHDDKEVSSVITKNVSPIQEVEVSEIFGGLLFRPRVPVYYMTNDDVITREVMEIMIREHDSLMKAIDVEAPHLIVGAV
ncbi:hypothetical protein PROFUN_09600 [Planoprotostelium fungivorum]|uniref:Rho-GAP domain-containing protein n=1 Tax=Planoprotostelium fungivorum TaxID=1890364 RepID=A0A2P6NGV9_9EUKA|nr:hypothetical protein PROFUN_09600 [Planoprotostelium fungivorum]